MIGVFGLRNSYYNNYLRRTVIVSKLMKTMVLSYKNKYCRMRIRFTHVSVPSHYCSGKGQIVPRKVHYFTNRRDRFAFLCLGHSLWISSFPFSLDETVPAFLRFSLWRNFKSQRYTLVLGNYTDSVNVFFHGIHFVYSVLALLRFS